MTAQVVWANEVQFAPTTTSPAEARDFVALHLSRHELGYLVDDVRLVVSELVTNAVVHARTPLMVRLEELLFCVKLTVYDECADRPVLRLEQRVAPETEGGRGLWITDACSADWGANLGNGAGKSTWALFGVRPRSSWVH